MLRCHNTVRSESSQKHRLQIHLAPIEKNERTSLSAVIAFISNLRYFRCLDPAALQVTASGKQVRYIQSFCSSGRNGLWSSLTAFEVCPVGLNKPGSPETWRPGLPSPLRRISPLNLQLRVAIRDVHLRKYQTACPDKRDQSNKYQSPSVHLATPSRGHR